MPFFTLLCFQAFLNESIMLSFLYQVYTNATLLYIQYVYYIAIIHKSVFLIQISHFSLSCLVVS